MRFFVEDVFVGECEFGLCGFYFPSFKSFYFDKRNDSAIALVSYRYYDINDFYAIYTSDLNGKMYIFDTYWLNKNKLYNQRQLKSIGFRYKDFNEDFEELYDVLRENIESEYEVVEVNK